MPIIDPSQQAGYVAPRPQYTAPAPQYSAPAPQYIAPSAPISGIGAGNAFSPGAYDYFNQGAAELDLRQAGMFLDNDQFYASLGLDRWQAEELARQWAQEFGWSKEQSIAQMLMQQQQMSGYMQTQPYLDANGALVGGGTQNTLGRDIAEWQNTLGQGNLGLNYLQLLGSQSGPRDWLSYARTVRGAEGTGLPTWAEALQGGQNLPAFGAAYQANQLSPVYDQFIGQPQGTTYNPYGVNQGQQAMAQGPTLQGALTNTGGVIQPYAGPQAQAPSTNAWAQAAAQQAVNGQMVNYAGQQQAPYLQQGANQQATGYMNDMQKYAGAPATTTNATPGMPTWALPIAHKVTAAQWQNMLPSEREMFMGAVEDAGAYAPDYMQQMQNAWPTRKVAPVTRWG